MTARHDEYWSLGERNALEDARDQGLSMAFNLPRAIAAAPGGYLVADTGNHRILQFSNDPGALIRR